MHHFKLNFFLSNLWKSWVRDHQNETCLTNNISIHRNTYIYLYIHINIYMYVCVCVCILYSEEFRTTQFAHQEQRRRIIRTYFTNLRNLLQAIQLRTKQDELLLFKQTNRQLLLCSMEFKQQTNR